MHVIGSLSAHPSACSVQMPKLRMIRSGGEGGGVAGVGDGGSGGGEVGGGGESGG